MAKRTEKDFLEWTRSLNFYCGEARYNQFSGAHVIVADPAGSDETRDLVVNLSGSDDEALRSAKLLNEKYNDGDIWLAFNDDPALAMLLLVTEIRQYYFEVLNND